MAELSVTYLPLVFGPPPTPTLTLTPTPTPLPTMGPNDITVLPNYTTNVDTFNFLSIRGEIINNTGVNFNYIEVLVDIQDENHNQLKTFLNSTPLEYLAPGEKTCFEMRNIKPTGWKYLSFEPILKQVDTWEIPNLEVSNLGMYYDASFSTYHVTGKVTNKGTIKANGIRAVATAYNQSGEVIGCQYAGVTTININPGYYGLFDIMFSGENYKDFKTFRVQASGTVQ